MGLELPVWGAPTVTWIAATLGLVGASVLDRFLDDDGSDDDDSGGMGDDDPFGGGGMGGGGMGGSGMGGSGMGGGGMGGGFDDFDGMDEWDDGFDDGGGGGGGAGTDELENRLDELENEVASLSSTVSTVRSENEEISAAVDDIEEDVRNLLDIYEMVTRGINPFVDESSGFDSVSGGGEGSFGLFDNDGEDDSADELDEDVANADADGFFDDEMLDDEFDDDEFDDDGDEFDADGDEFDGLEGELGDDHTDGGDSADAASATTAADEGDDMNDDGKSFSELKEEYDAGEADWADEEGDDGDAGSLADDDPFEDGDDSFDDDLGDEMEPLDEGTDSFDEGTDSFDEGTDPFDDEFGDETDPLNEGMDSFDEGAATDADPATNGHGSGRKAEHGSGPEPEPDSELEPGSERGATADRTRGSRPGGDPSDANGGGFEYVGEDDLSGSRGKPYLTELPGDYVGDLLVMEWLEFLVSESDVTDAVRAINYYERIEWVGPEAAARLRDFLSGFGTIDRNLIDRPGTDRLVREHHTRSLRYVTQLNGTSGHLLLLDRWDDLAGGSLVGGCPPPSGGRDRGRDAGAPRPVADPDPRSDRADPRSDRADSRSDRADSRSDRADPADGGWGNGR